MDFKECFTSYINLTQCSAGELASLTQLSASTISRYKKGERTPDKNSDVFSLLGQAFSRIASEKNISCPEAVQIEKELKTAAAGHNYQIISSRLSLFMESLSISAAALSDYMNYDASYISRVRYNKRQPSDIGAFISKICSFSVEFLRSSENTLKLAEITGVQRSAFEDSSSHYSTLYSWFFENDLPEDNPSDVSDFLSKLDDFNLDDYIEAIHFNDIKIPNVPLKLVTRKDYVGIEEMRTGELDFFKAAVLSKSSEPVTMCVDMPMSDMAEDMDFSKKWMFGLAMILKKGLTLNIIHNLDRPFDELMLGLESWIPLYMTGQVRPYYFREPNSNIYGHLHYTSGDAALFGECILGRHDIGRYYLTRKKEEVALFKEYTAELVKKASPLMKIYTSRDRHAFDAFFFDHNNFSKAVTHNYTSLPLYTMEEELLDCILKRSALTPDEISSAKKYYSSVRDMAVTTLESSTITDYISIISEESFEIRKPYLLLSGAFLGREVYYTYEEYKAHLKSTREFEKANDRYTFLDTGIQPFKNVQITTVKGKWALISKNNHPNIHFLIYHPVLRDAIENSKINIPE